MNSNKQSEVYSSDQRDVFGFTPGGVRFDLEGEAEAHSHALFASTLANGLEVLRCFSVDRPVLGNKDIAKALGMTKPTVSRLTFTLMAMGYLVRDADTGRYSIGPALLALSHPLLAQLTCRQLAMYDMVELARFARGPVSMGMRDRLQVVYVETVHDQEQNGARPDIGSVRPLLRTAMGRALLYGHGQEERDYILKRLQKAYPEEFERFGSKVGEAREAIEQEGFCTSFGEFRPDLFGIAVPLRMPGGQSPLAVSLTVPAYTTDKERVSKVLGPKLRELARNMEYRLGVVP